MFALYRNEISGYLRDEKCRRKDYPGPDKVSPFERWFRTYRLSSFVHVARRLPDRLPQPLLVTISRLFLAAYSFYRIADENTLRLPKTGVFSLLIFLFLVTFRINLTSAC